MDPGNISDFWQPVKVIFINIAVIVPFNGKVADRRQVTALLNIYTSFLPVVPRLRMGAEDTAQWKILADHQGVAVAINHVDHRLAYTPILNELIALVET